MIEAPPGWDDGLDERQASFIGGFIDGGIAAGELMARMRADIGLQFALARADTRPHLLRWFSERDIDRGGGWVPEPERSGPIGADAVGTEWSWTGVHARRPGGREGEIGFNNTAPSDREVVVRGFTLMSLNGGELEVRRYVDWAGVFAQLGLTLNWRTPTAAPDSTDGG